MTKVKGKRYTDFATACKWIGNKILCNEIQGIDSSIFDNMRFDFEDDDGNTIDIYQWFITDCNEHDVEYLEKTFDMKFTYSDMLGLYILCVTHFGTPWNGVDVEILNDDLPDDIVEAMEKR